MFYGQLALERLGRPVPAPVALSSAALTPAQRAAFGANRLAQATRLLGSQGRRDEQALFVRALGESLKTRDERLLATELGQQIGRQDLAVWVARSARNNGQAFYARQAFPTHNSGVPGGRIWSLAHGITRQESSFDRTAVSHANARGLMQLMPGTAREVSTKMGLGYNPGALTTDTDYNIMVGSNY
ncbi:MAG: lytic transglycosylase domain-containing protein, partial [Sphingomicrobium sp.]